ncbi:deoxyuridine 5'-triphosphate nucleotidohydrolase-like [Folsomia candida]|uniref:deoxyuridine 5'-triphosphate nucleotidohydrolase-like n=1 Tax=Folsomia candida TaxID=158441 RepID=UPI0016050271|nr:deoxyuridine 5'-triphosphate nucleotidohydrolase-like [Folsomia candida]
MVSYRDKQFQCEAVATYSTSSAALHLTPFFNISSPNNILIDVAKLSLMTVISAYKYTVPARGSCMVKTDIQIKLPSGYYGRVAPRSGLALKNKLDVGGNNQVDE